MLVKSIPNGAESSSASEAIACNTDTHSRRHRGRLMGNPTESVQPSGAATPRGPAAAGCRRAGLRCICEGAGGGGSAARRRLTSSRPTAR